MTHAIPILLMLAQLHPADPRGVRPGIEVLLADSAHLVAGRRVGLVANRAAIDGHGTHAIERLRQAGVRLVALFSPEHGFRGTAAPGEPVASTVDSATGLPIYSLYGDRTAPTAEMLRPVDLLAVDLPDVGARYFTYLSTTLEVMRAAAREGKRVVILDRPNPIGGRLVQGNVLEPQARSFVGPLAVPMRPGLTLAELARMGNDELAIGADLRVVPAAGWRRADDLLDTGLPFVAPSPNLPNAESLFHYPGFCLFEGTALSVGRGTDAPFSQIGAPWLDTVRVLARVRAAGPEGVRFEGVAFTPLAPGDGKFAGTRLLGIRLRLTDRRRYDPTRTALILLAAVRAVHREQIGFLSRSFDRLAGGPALRLAIEAGVDPDSIVASWRPALAAFESRRQAVMIYRD